MVQIFFALLTADLSNYIIYLKCSRIAVFSSKQLVSVSASVPLFRKKVESDYYTKFRFIGDLKLRMKCITHSTIETGFSGFTQCLQLHVTCLYLRDCIL